VSWNILSVGRNQLLTICRNHSQIQLPAESRTASCSAR
jgi:hypothetical protein